jgi:anion-transporting  ArsA/GET3 family ATPase
MATDEHLKQLGDGDDGDPDLGPVGIWADQEQFRQSKFFAEILNRLVSGRDINVIVTASSETGVGKTTLAVALALLIDQHGWTADKASVADPADYDRRYDQCPPGSCLILDEAEKAMDSRRSMTKESVSLSQTFATKRYRQVFSILTAPSKSWIDKRLGDDAADYWIQALSTDLGRIKGEAKCYRLQTNEHYEVNYAKRTEFLHWPKLDDNAEFQKLDQRKRDLLESEGGESKYVDGDDVEEMKQEAADTAAQRQRRRIMQRLDDRDEMTQSKIADVFDLSKTRVNQIIND